MTAGLPPGDLEAFRKGVEEFNRGFYFECHDTLEDIWTGTRGDMRNFLQGLIQVSVACYHLGRGNDAGARSMMLRALKRFEGYPDRFFGFDLAAARAELDAWLVRLDSGEVGPVESSELPKWAFEELREPH